MAGGARSIIVPIIAGFSGDGIKKAQKQLSDLGGTLGRIGDQTIKASAAFAATKVWQGFAAAIQESTTQARNLERNLAAVDTVFGKLSPQIERFSEGSVALGMNQAEAAKASVFLGSVLKQSGFSIDETANQTERLVKLASDLSITYGYDVQEALLGMTALFRGEYDPIEKFGVAMKQSEINSELAARGLDGLEGSARRLAEQQIRLELLYSRSQDAQGAFGRQAGTLAVEQEKLQATFENLMAKAGAPLMKVFATMAQEMVPIIESLTPSLISLFEQLAKETVNVLKNQDNLAEVVLNAARALSDIGRIAAVVGGFLLQNAEAIKNIVVALVAFKVSSKIFTVASAAVLIYKNALSAAKDATILLDSVTKKSLIGLAVSAVAVGASYLLEWAMAANEAADSTDGLDESVKANVDRLAELKQHLIDLQGFRDWFPLINALAGGDAQIEGTIRQINALENVMEKTGKEGVGSIGKAIGESAGELTRFGNISKGFFAGFVKQADEAVVAVDPLQTIWDEIAAAQRQSEVTEQLEQMGFNAGAIAQILKQEDWEAIFGVISRYARIAALDITKIGGSAQYAAAVAQGKAQAELDAMLKRLNDANPVTISGGSGKAKEEAVDYVQAYMDQLENSLKELSATNKLKSMGFTQGQIDQILNSEGWEKIYKKILEGNDKFLEKIQVDYAASAEGIAERTKETQDAVNKAIEASDKLMAKYEKELDAWERLRDAAYDYRDALVALGKFTLDPSFEKQLGKFEAAVVNRFQNIREQIAEGLADKRITDASSKTLLEYVKTEEAAIRAIEVKRDELANRYDLAEALIAEYRTALTGALNLNTLFQQIGNKTKEVTITEVTEGVAVLGGSLKEFGVTVTRSYQKTVDEVTDKSAALIDNFRKMADKAKGFADNLRKLKQLGLDPQLMAQLVQAGVEAGGETAQALVDGGADSIKELNNIYAEIDSVGKSLGENVAETLYGTGISMSNGLLDGILSKMDEYKKAAQTLADTFATEFKTKVGTAVNELIPAAPTAPTNVLTEADKEKLEFLMRRRAERTAEYSSIPVEKTEWRNKLQLIVGSYTTQIEDILAKVTPFAKGGIVTSPVMGLVGEAGPEAIIPLNKMNGLGTTYNIYVNANDRAGGKAAGDAIITALSTTVARNGSLLNVVTGR